MISIGQNDSILSSKGNINFAVGQKIAALRKALREANELYGLISQLSDADLVALSFGDGNNGTPNEIGYLRSALADAGQLYVIYSGGSTERTLPFDFRASMAYVAATGI
jgi:hypothetical protein